MIKKIKVKYDSTPESHLSDVESLLEEFGVTYNKVDYDGLITITYDKDYKDTKKEFEESTKNALALSKDVVQYAKALYKKQPTLPEGYNNGRIVGPKSEWTFEECVNEAVMVMYKWKFGGFAEPMIVGTTDLEIQPVWNIDNNYDRNHGQ
jgi:hypothetical protein